jgi:hypothetical protein
MRVAQIARDAVGGRGLSTRAASDETLVSPRYVLVKDDDSLDNMQLLVHEPAKGDGFSLAPCHLPGLGEHQVSKVACGAAHFLVLLSNGQGGSSEKRVCVC